MKIAVTYSNGEIFQHFGHTEQFKVYTVEGNKILSAEVIDTNGSGHGALAGLLSGLNVDVLICGGIGGGAQMALPRQASGSMAASQATQTRQSRALPQETSPMIPTPSVTTTTITTVRSTPAVNTAAAAADAPIEPRPQAKAPFSQTEHR